MTILYFSFLGSIVGLTNKILGKIYSCYLIIGCLAGAFISAVIQGYNVLLQQGQIIYEVNWMLISDFTMKFSFEFNVTTTILAMLITFITLLVMTYSYGYLNEDPNHIKFLSYLSFFAFTMLMMATSANYVQLFVGWEGVGLASYLLISFWDTRNEANQGGLKAITVNRIGDVFFLLALALMWSEFESFDINKINAYYTLFADQGINVFTQEPARLLNLLPFCLLIAAWSKSAQMLLHVWLGDAMEGPTPVSSLLHSATMVTAGVFLLMRSSELFSHGSAGNIMIGFLGLVTAVTSGLIGYKQTDIKKVIAYSTCSQLGYMVFACGLGAFHCAVFHLVTHAFFKCLLFLCSGSVIHAVADNQDIRKMGLLYTRLPLTATIMTLHH